ncbi:MAG: DUF2247 family protein [Chthoniobacterales bacterium]
MSAIVTKIPYEFACKRVPLSWQDVQFGLERQLIAPQVAIQKAMDRLSASTDATPDEIELAGRSAEEPVLQLVSRLAARDTIKCDEIQSKWLYLLLAWILENCALLNDPLRIVEEVYAAFDYPSEIASFVRYMPMVGPDLGNREQNEARLYDRWKSYVAEAAKRFSDPSGRW